MRIRTKTYHSVFIYKEDFKNFNVFSPVLKKNVSIKVQLRKKEPTEVTSSKKQFRKVESMKVTDFSFIPMNLKKDILLLKFYHSIITVV